MDWGWGSETVPTKDTTNSYRSKLSTTKEINRIFGSILYFFHTFTRNFEAIPVEFMWARFMYKVDNGGGSGAAREQRNLHGKTENRVGVEGGGGVEGEYRVLLPDMRTQVVRCGGGEAVRSFHLRVVLFMYVRTTQ